jgi:EAL domain-containing protein (putative c-di-GMP-specific phosphodiesterase class I)
MFDRAHLSTARIMDDYKTAISYYDDNIRNNILEEQKLASQLFDALKEDQIVPYLQPITDKNGKVVGAEALARWIHPEYGFLPPYKFIPVFEKNGLITELDNHIWECACQILQKWKKEYNDLFISINISPKDFYFTDVVAELNKLVQKYDIDTSRLRIEITETAMFSDVEEKIHIFNKLKESGFIIEIDDFGSGYSSLNMLKDMPVDVLKIDMNFLSKDDNKSKKIVKNVIHLSNDLSITSLTEGVETEQQYKQLAQMGCSLFQGYYFAKPMPVSEFEEFIKQ